MGQQRRGGSMVQRGLAGLCEVGEHVPLLLAQRFLHGEYALDEAAAFGAARTEADLAPQYSMAEGLLSISPLRRSIPTCSFLVSHSPSSRVAAGRLRIESLTRT